MSKRRQRVLITGINGMLGSDLAEAFSGYSIYGIGRKKVGKNKSGTYVAANLQDVCFLKKTLHNIQPDIVIHTAAKTQVDECERLPLDAYRNNVLATGLLLESLKKYRPLFIYISTDYVFDGGKSSAYTETDRCRPLNVYGASKWLGEELVRNAEFPWVIIRTSWLYGKNGPNFVTAILNKARHHQKLSVVVDQHGAPTYTKDLACALRKMAGQANISGVFHVTNSGSTNWFDYAKFIAEEAHLNHVRVLPIRTKDSARPAMRPRNSLLSTKKFEKKTGIKLRPWNEALRDYLKGLKIK